MKLDRIHQISEIVASIAIVASLVFVGLQVNQNTNALRNAAAQSNSESWQDLTLTLATNPQLAEIWSKSVRKQDDVPFEMTGDMLQLAIYCGANLKSMESNYHQWLNGNLDDELFQAAREAFVFELESQPLYEVILNGFGQRLYTQRFVSFAKEALVEANANLTRTGAPIS